MKPTSLLFVALVAISALAPTSEAVCANMAVYTDCKNRGTAQLNGCAFDDWNCKCNANNALQNCYLQCPDDLDIQNEGKAYQPAVQQSCQLAASQSSAKAAATPVAATPLATQPAPVQTPPPTVPSSSPSTPSETPKTNNAKSSADSNKINVMIAAVPPVAALIIGQFV
ncbi:unnamed protein product [Rhizophagus irregularis]|nr:unnamed protein product [Rhizophagus irregularis]